MTPEGEERIALALERIADALDVDGATFLALKWISESTDEIGDAAKKTEDTLRCATVALSLGEDSTLVGASDRLAVRVRTE